MIVSVHLPLLVMISGSSANEPTQTWPKFPLSAMIRFAFGVRADAGDGHGRGSGRVVAEDGDRAGLRTGAVGWKRIGHVDRIARTDPERVARDARREEIRGPG